jgi:AraC-like DNA-binding protein
VSEHLDFQLFQPKGRLAAAVQGVWSTSISPHSPHHIKRWLQSDACSGIIFNLNSTIQLNDTVIDMGSVLQPVSKQAQEITLPPNAAVVGVRFHPGMSFAILGSLYQQATLIKPHQNNCQKTSSKNDRALNSLNQQLKMAQGHYARITVLYRWLENILLSIDGIPASLTTALAALENKKSPGELSNNIALSQRQIERQFQKWLDMTPKYYQRISRVKNALKKLKEDPRTVLADLALSEGFTDQAHMTREFNDIARITPKQYSQKIIDDNTHKNIIFLANDEVN